MTKLNFNLIPYGKNILFKPREVKQIAVGDKAFLADYGKVIAIGEDVKKVKVGDIIVVRKWGLIDVAIDKEVFIFVPEDEKFIISTITDFTYE